MSEQPNESQRDDETGTSLPGMISDAGRELGSDEESSGTASSGLTSDSDGTPVGQADVEADAESSGADRSAADPGAV